jgi:hypothetical protein
VPQKGCFPAAEKSCNDCGGKLAHRWVSLSRARAQARAPPQIRTGLCSAREWRPAAQTKAA